MFTVRHTFPDGRTERQTFEELNNAIRAANAMPQWEGAETDILDSEGFRLMSRGWADAPLPVEEDEQPEPGEKLQTDARPTWKRGKHATEVISDQPTADQMGGADSLDYYGGYLVAESVAPSLVPLISAAPDMIEVLETVNERSGKAQFNEKTGLYHFGMQPNELLAVMYAIAKARGQA